MTPISGKYLESVEYANPFATLIAFCKVSILGSCTSFDGL